MLNELNSESDPGQPVVYEIRIKGHLGREWTDWFLGLTIQLQDNGETLLTGPVVDQAALYGLLRKVRDVGMPLVSVMRVPPGQAVTKAHRCNATLSFKRRKHMKTTNKTTARKERKVILSTLWIFAMFNYAYADILTLWFNPVLQKDATKQLLSGYVGSIHITQGFVLVGAVLMETAIAMVLLSRVLPYRANRWANIIVGVLQTASVAWSLSPNLFYIFFAAIEMACTLFIVWYAWTWPRLEGGVLTSAGSGLLNARQSKQEEAKRQDEMSSEGVQVPG